MLEGRELVVEGRRARDAEPARRHGQLVRAVCERDVEVAGLRPLLQRAEAVRHLPRLLHTRASAVTSDHLCGEAVQLEQLKGLRVVARRDLDLVAALPHQLDQRTEHQHVCARRHVDPDAHQIVSTTRKRTATISVSGAIGCWKKSSWATRQSSTDSKPSPSSRAKSTSISEAGTRFASVTSTIATGSSSKSCITNRSPALGTASPSASYSDHSPAVAVFAPVSTASTSCRRSSVRGEPSS